MKANQQWFAFCFLNYKGTKTEKKQEGFFLCWKRGNLYKIQADEY